MIKHVGVLGLLLLLGGCFEQTPEEAWLDKMYEKCFVMRGHAFYDKDQHSIECYRAPVGRMTKELFKESFK